MGLRVVGARVEVRAPVRASASNIRGFVERKAEWIWDKLRENKSRPVIPPFGHGESVPYLGKPTAITTTQGRVRAIAVSLHDDDCNALIEPPLYIDFRSKDFDRTAPLIYLGAKHFHLTVPAGLEGSELRDGIQRALEAWYRTRVAEVFQEALAHWRSIVAPQTKPEIRISNARSQWGSCSANGVLRFSWRCLMLDEGQIEYIAVHELAHLKVRNHSKAFWRVVVNAMPDAVDVQRSITKDSRALPR